MLLLDILGQITYLGGYNSKLQDLATELTIKTLLQLLEVNYLIYMLTENPIRNVKILEQTSQSSQGFITLNIESLKDIIRKSMNEEKILFIKNEDFLKLNSLP